MFSCEVPTIPHATSLFCPYIFSIYSGSFFSGIQSHTFNMIYKKITYLFCAILYINNYQQNSIKLIYLYDEIFNDLFCFKVGEFSQSIKEHLILRFLWRIGDRWFSVGSCDYFNCYVQAQSFSLSWTQATILHILDCHFWTKKVGSTSLSKFEVSANMFNMSQGHVFLIKYCIVLCMYVYIYCVSEWLTSYSSHW